MDNKPKRPRCLMCGEFMKDVSILSSHVIDCKEEMLFYCRGCSKRTKAARYFVKNKWNRNSWIELNAIPVGR